MRKFIIRIFLFLFPIIFILISMEFLLRNIPNDYLYKSEYLNSNSNKIEVLFLGSSHIYYGINPKYINAKSFNASYVSQSLDYDLAILEKYEKKLDNLKCIVVPIDYFSLYSKLESGVEKWRVKNYKLYYHINEGYDFYNDLEISNGKFENNLFRIGSYYVKGKNPVTTDRLGWGTICSSMEGKDLMETGVSAAKRHTVNLNIEYFQENIRTLNRIIEFGNSRKIKMIFITCPGYKSYVDNLEKNQINNTVNAVINLSSKNKNTSYYNMLDNKLFEGKDFYDADHLNEIGAKKLTLIINDLIKKEIKK